MLSEQEVNRRHKREELMRMGIDPYPANLFEVTATIADVRAGRGGAVPPHLRGSGYAGATQLGHGAGYTYTHDEPDGVGPQQFLPDDLLPDADYYYPTSRGWEERLGERWRRLRAVIRGGESAT